MNFEEAKQKRAEEIAKPLRQEGDRDIFKILKDPRSAAEKVRDTLLDIDKLKE
jgi:hypothetical protein